MKNLEFVVSLFFFLITNNHKKTKKNKGKEGSKQVAITGGVVEVLKNKVILLATGLAA